MPSPDLYPATPSNFLFSIASVGWTEPPPNLSERVNHIYRGCCPATDTEYELPRTSLIESLAKSLVSTIRDTEPKMFGLLLVENDKGERGLLRAFSGRWKGSFHHPGWVPPIFEFKATPNEASTKKRLSEIKLELQNLGLEQQAERLRTNEKSWSERLSELQEELRINKRARDEHRQQKHDELELQSQSRADKRRLREFKLKMREALEPIKQEVEELKGRSSELKSARKQMSRKLQAQMHDALSQDLWCDRPWSLASLFPKGPPTGVGECCAPKLLHFAQLHGLKPLALAEIWWGGETSDRHSGEFYPACLERCQPLFGALFSTAKMNYVPLFEDEHVIVIDKPTGVLSVPGRQTWNQDSVLSRWSRRVGPLFPVHRLDMETSGVLMLAKTPEAQVKFQQLFASRQVEKQYQALLAQQPRQAEGEVNLSLARDESRIGCYVVHNEGKAAFTSYETLEPTEARVLFKPQTGRSHQLRIHAAEGLGSPIRGDRLYGSSGATERLKLHAWKLKLQHPFTEKELCLEAELPF